MNSDPPPSYQDIYLTDQVITARINRENVNSGELHAALIWNDIADLDLHCITPSGEHLYFGHKESRCGGWLDIDMNATGNNSLEPIENVFFASAPSGRYKIYVNNYNNRTDSNTVFTDSNRRVPFRVMLTRNGIKEWFDGSVGPRENVNCFEFDFNGSGAVGSFIILPEYTDKTTFQAHCERHNVTYRKGTGFYALIKKEKVSAKKDVILYNTLLDTFDIGRICVFNKLNLDANIDHDIRPNMVPDNHVLFVQSTSHNRNIPAGIKMLVNVGIREALKYRRSNIYTNL